MNTEKALAEQIEDMAEDYAIGIERPGCSLFNGLRRGFIDGYKAGLAVEFGEWQLCPKCEGQGKVSRPPWINGDVYEWTASETSHTCDVCNGAKVLVKPYLPAAPIKPKEK